jgi:hypothetical protein
MHPPQLRCVFPKMRFAAQIGANKLQRDRAIDEDVAGAGHDTHAAFTRTGLESVPSRDDTAQHRICGLAEPAPRHRFQRVCFAADPNPRA